MAILAQLLFVTLFCLFSYLLARRIILIRKNILLGREIGNVSNKSQRIKNVLLIAFGQKKMFKKFIPAILHLFIYVGFILINIEVLEIILDGILGTHRLLVPFLGNFYSVLISFFEVLSVLVIVACLIFLVRRNIIKVSRLNKPEMKGWPAMDGNLILIIEILLMAAILSMNAADQVLQNIEGSGYGKTGSFIVSSFLTPFFKNHTITTLMLIERSTWWLHIVGIFAFAIYVTYSKHLHIFMAFPNTYFGRLYPKGQMDNMPEITNEVKIMLGVNTEGDSGPPPEGMKFGANDIHHLTRKNLMDAYSCTECGRCTAECPANLTGKKLSPRKIMMDTRDRMEEVGRSLHKGGKGVDDGKSLLGNYITKEEINACTSCNACVEACPVTINPLDIILQLRRYVSMEESASPASWNAMFQT